MLGWAPGMFDIAFTSDAPEQQPDGWVGLWGRTQLGACAEDFLAPLGPWQRADYERQWIEAARRLLGPASRAAFFTASFRFWWVLWREGEEVIAHEELLLPERLEGLTDWRPRRIT
jgi:CdiI N-terminal domain